MAENIEALVVKIASDVSELKSGLGEAKKDVGGFGRSVRELGNVIGVVFGAKTIIDFFKKSSAEAAEAEDVTNRLTSALRAQGDTTTVVRDDVLKYSSQMQKATTFSDEQITSAQTLLIQLAKLRGEGLQTATQAAADMAAALGMDLQSSTQLVAKAMVNGGSILRRYGIDVKETGDKAKDAEAVLRALNEKFGGAANAQVNTYRGSVAQLKNAFSDLQEVVGNQMNPALETAARFWTEMVQNLNEYLEASGKTKTASAENAQHAKDIQTALAMTSNSESLAESLDVINQVPDGLLEGAAAASNVTVAQLRLKLSTEAGRASLRHLANQYRETSKEAEKLSKVEPPKIAQVGEAEALEARNQKIIDEAMRRVQNQKDMQDEEVQNQLDAENRMHEARALGQARASEAREIQLEEQRQAAIEERAIIEQTSQTLGAAFVQMAFDQKNAQAIWESTIQSLMAEFVRMAITKIVANAFVAGTGVAAQQAPITGPVAIGTGLASAAALAALAGQIPAFAKGGKVGGSLGQNDPNLIRVNRGEEVLRQDDPRHVDNLGVGTPTFNLYFQQLLPQSEAETARQVKRAMIPILNDMIGTGELRT